MKLTNGEIVNAKEPMTQLVAEKFPVKTSLALITLVRKLDEFLIPVEQVRDGLFKMYGEPSPDDPRRLQCLPLVPKKDDDGNAIKDGAGNVTLIDNPNFPKLIAEMNELMSQEVEVVIKRVEVPDTLQIEPTVLMALEKFIKVG